MKIERTKNYSMFSLLPMNRQIQSRHVQTMIKSIRSLGIIRPVIITRTDCLEGKKLDYVVDGQHLLTAAEREGETIPYVRIEVKDEYDLVMKMALLNNSSKSWALIDYVNAFKTIKKDYMTLLKWKNLYNLEPLMIATICGAGAVSIKGMSAAIKEGRFEITNPNAQNMAKAFSEIFLVIGLANRWVKMQFLNVFIKKYGTYNHKATLANVKTHIKDIRTMSNDVDSYKYISETIFI